MATTSTTVLHIKTDVKLKKEIQKIADEINLSVSQIINKLLQDFSETRELHFAPKYKMTEYLERVLKKSVKDKDGDISFTDMKKMDKYLMSL